MLNVKIDENGNSIEVSGNVVEISADVGLLIKVIYDGLESDKCKDFFAHSLKRFMNEEIYKKSDEELCEENKKKLEEKCDNSKKELVKDLKELIEMLGKFVK